MKTSIIYVVGYEPSPDTENAVGGLEWRVTHSDALAELAGVTEFFGREMDYCLVTVEVPFEKPLSVKEEVTAWLEDRPELWQPPHQPSIAPLTGVTIEHVISLSQRAATAADTLFCRLFKSPGESWPAKSLDMIHTKLVDAMVSAEAWRERQLEENNDGSE